MSGTDLQFGGEHLPVPPLLTHSYTPAPFRVALPHTSPWRCPPPHPGAAGRPEGCHLLFFSAGTGAAASPLQQFKRLCWPLGLASVQSSHFAKDRHFLPDSWQLCPSQELSVRVFQLHPSHHFDCP